MSSFLFVNPTAIEEIVDEKTGELKTLRLNCTELAPRSFNVNLIKQDASVRNHLQAFVNAKQPIMLPIKEGITSDGSPYFQLLPGQIIPVSLEYAATLSAVSAPIPAALADAAQAKPLFGDVTKRAGAASSS